MRTIVIPLVWITLSAAAGCALPVEEPLGAQGQPCLADGSCNPRLACNEQGTCAPPAEDPQLPQNLMGGPGQACYPNASCNPGYVCSPQLLCVENDGPDSDAASVGTEVEPYTRPGGVQDQCFVTTPSQPIPWISQKLGGLSWTGNMCCGPATLSMVQAAAEARTPTEADLRFMIDWMGANLASWAPNGYQCSGTDSDQMVQTLRHRLGLEAEAIRTDWCSLAGYLDGDHVVIFHGDSQGGNLGTAFLPGKSHWLILESVNGITTYVNDPGRSYSSQGNSRAFTTNSVRERFEIRGGIAIIISLTSTSDPCGQRVCGPDGEGGSCGTCPAGDSCTAQGQCVCAPETCSDLGKQCGQWPDGCGSTVSCGVCPSGETCEADGQCHQGCAAVCDWRECGTYNGCTCGACNVGESCSNYQCDAPYITASPSSGWTPAFSADTACSCSTSNLDCHTLYVGRVDSISGNTATLSFEKTTGGGPSVNVHYWIVVGGATYPSCLDIPAFVTRQEGTWYSGDSVLTASNVNVWPDQQAFDIAQCGATKKLFIITGGQGYPNDRIWFQKRALVFTKVCP